MARRSPASVCGMMAAMSDAPSPPTARGERQVYCLCAEWCGVCREWRAIFDAQAAAHPGDRFAWIDVDAHEDVLDLVEIETFPVLLIAEQGRVVFFGPMEPSAGMLGRLLERAQAAPSADGEAERLLQSLQAG
jgi:thioredoxin 1